MPQSGVGLFVWLGLGWSKVNKEKLQLLPDSLYNLFLLLYSETNLKFLLILHDLAHKGPFHHEREKEKEINKRELPGLNSTAQSSQE